MQQYIMDDRVILAIQGLRSIKKNDRINYSVNTDNTYEIIWNYKGSDGFISYRSKEERNKIFNEIKKLIEEREKDHIRRHGPNLS